jgi:predicted nucleic acid-binding protein
MEISPALADAAMRLADVHELRAYDAVQLAAALEVNSRWLAAGMGGITLVSADHALNDAALAEGLAVDDPRSHP